VQVNEFTRAKVAKENGSTLPQAGLFIIHYPSFYLDSASKDSNEGGDLSKDTEDVSSLFGSDIGGLTALL
ncbi:hypothetical protein Tco_0550167, partial [Tanacetum coccineum]